MYEFTLTPALLHKVCDALGWSIELSDEKGIVLGSDEGEIVVRPRYSGRGMYGATCVGIVHDSSVDTTPFVLALLWVLTTNMQTERHDPSDVDLVALLETQYTLGRAQHDSMGLSEITYWTRLGFAANEEDKVAPALDELWEVVLPSTSAWEVFVQRKEGRTFVYDSEAASLTSHTDRRKAIEGDNEDGELIVHMDNCESLDAAQAWLDEVAPLMPL
jgi:hypothetical protein